MKILLLGEYSNVHWTLAQGLRTLGHEVTVLSNGDFWKNYPCDIKIVRHYGKLGGIKYMIKLLCTLPRLRGYDVVQLINPMFLEIKADRIFKIYQYLRRNNGKIFLGGFGMDYYWVKTCCEKKILRYSDFNIGDELRTNNDAVKERKDWLDTSKERLNKYIAHDCDGIITGLYEYWVCYHPAFPGKTVFIPYPINIEKQKSDSNQISNNNIENKVKIFIGINTNRSEYKGTDIMLKAAKAIETKYPDKMALHIAQSVPFEKYQRLMDGCDAILDQLYSYTPSMNSLLAMSKGIICIGGGEPENYEILNEEDLKPIINVEPNFDSVYKQLETLILHPEIIPELKRQSKEYIRLHHDYIQVAKQYEEFYNKSTLNPQLFF